jgi:hypothetical protein
MPSPLRAALFAAVCLLAGPRQARADLTVFAGLQTAVDTRPATGISVGLGLLLLGWEVEVARANGQQATLIPSLATGTASVYVQNPIPISGLQFYAIAGAGVYRERLDATYQQTDGHLAVGGGVKIGLAGPLKLRLDYRFFKLRDALSESPQRVYAGLTLSF